MFALHVAATLEQTGEDCRLEDSNHEQGLKAAAPISKHSSKESLTLYLNSSGQFSNDFHERFLHVEGQLVGPVDSCYDEFHEALSRNSLEGLNTQLAASLLQHGAHLFVNMLQPNHYWLHESLPLKTWIRAEVCSSLNYTKLRGVLFEHRDSVVIPEVLLLLVPLICRWVKR